MKIFENRIELLSVVPKESVCCEIGVLTGWYSNLIIDIVRPSKFYTIDPWDCDFEYPTFIQDNKIKISSKKAKSVFMETMKPYISSNICIVLEGKNQDVIHEIPNNTVDFIYIDGLHDYKNVLLDLELSFLKIKDGGIIAGHDFCLVNQYGVVMAVAVFCDRHHLNIDYMTNEKPVHLLELPYPKCPVEIAFNSFGIIVKK